MAALLLASQALATKDYNGGNGGAGMDYGTETPVAATTSSCTEATKLPAETAANTNIPAYTTATTVAHNTVPAAGEAQTIVHTVTVTADCNCATQSAATSVGLTLSAENPTATATATQTSVPAAAATHKVIVGGPAGLVYTPEFVMAAVGDKVVFDFLAKNHTVTQSTLNLPCLFKAGGVKSGFRPNPENTPGKETFEVAVESLDPTWYFCAQANHCELGMVFAINPKPGQMEQFKQTAMGANSTTPAPSGTGTGPVPSFTGAASGLTAKVGSALMGVAAVLALAA